MDIAQFVAIHRWVPFCDANGLLFSQVFSLLFLLQLGLSSLLPVSCRVGLLVVIYGLQHMKDLSAIFWFLVCLP